MKYQANDKEGAVGADQCPGTGLKTAATDMQKLPGGKFLPPGDHLSYSLSACRARAISHMSCALV